MMSLYKINLSTDWIIKTKPGWKQARGLEKKPVLFLKTVYILYFQYVMKRLECLYALEAWARPKWPQIY